MAGHECARLGWELLQGVEYEYDGCSGPSQSPLLPHMLQRLLLTLQSLLRGRRAQGVQLPRICAVWPARRLLAHLAPRARPARWLQPRQAAA